MDPNLQTAANIGGMNNESNNNPYVSPTPLSTTPSNGDNGHKKAWPMITILVVVLALVVAALYLFASGANVRNSVPEYFNNATVDEQGNIINPEDGISAEETQSVQPVTNTADDTQSLEQDLNSAIEGLDTQNF